MIANVAAAKVVVTDVGHGCAASGLLVKGDKIVSINGTRITDEVQGRSLAKTAVGEVIFSIQRGYEHVTVTGANLLLVHDTFAHTARYIHSLTILTPPFPSPSPSRLCP